MGSNLSHILNESLFSIYHKILMSQVLQYINKDKRIITLYFSKKGNESMDKKYHSIQMSHNIKIIN